MNWHTLLYPMDVSKHVCYDIFSLLSYLTRGWRTRGDRGSWNFLHSKIFLYQKIFLYSLKDEKLNPNDIITWYIFLCYSLSLSRDGLSLIYMHAIIIFSFVHIKWRWYDGAPWKWWYLREVGMEIYWI